MAHMRFLRVLRNSRSLIIAAVIAVVCAYISAFHVQLLLIRGNSMTPTYSSFTFALLNKHETMPERGDVIAFRVPGVKGALIKRVVGIPGDVLYASDAAIQLNGDIHPDYFGLKYYGVLNREVRLAEGEYFVMGDNTEESRDSRYEEIGIIHRDQIYGTVVPQRSYKSVKRK